MKIIPEYLNIRRLPSREECDGIIFSDTVPDVLTLTAHVSVIPKMI